MANPSLKLTILYGETDADLLASQADLIQKAGHSVEQAVARKGVEAALRQKKFDLVILGHTLSKNDRHHLPYMVKKASSEARVLVLHSAGHHPQVDASLDSPTPIEKILETISSLMAHKAMASKAAAAGSRG
jgi:DNA-binding NtrC family response regulator